MSKKIPLLLIFSAFVLLLILILWTGWYIYNPNRDDSILWKKLASRSNYNRADKIILFDNTKRIHLFQQNGRWYIGEVKNEKTKIANKNTVDKLLDALGSLTFEKKITFNPAPTQEYIIDEKTKIVSQVVPIGFYEVLYQKYGVDGKRKIQIFFTYTYTKPSRIEETVIYVGNKNDQGMTYFREKSPEDVYLTSIDLNKFFDEYSFIEN